MEYSKNFGVHSTAEEAQKLSNHLTIDTAAAITESYCCGYRASKGNIEWKQHRGLSAVYMLGFLSGARAVRGARNKC